MKLFPWSGLIPRDPAGLLFLERRAAINLDDVFVSPEALNALPEPNTADLTPERVSALFSDTITHVRDLVATTPMTEPALNTI